MSEIINQSKPELITDLGFLYPTETSKQRRRFGIYLCQCGNEFKAMVAHVNTGNTVSCGCYHKQRAKEANTVHGLLNHPLYPIWHAIIQRTTNHSNKRFNDYGGRGITICDEWRNDFKTFYDWCISNGYKKWLDIDRRDNNKGYSPENCRFSTKSVNSMNKRVLMSTNTSGFRGVSWNKKSNKFVAQIQTNGKKTYIGYFITSLEASKAYDKYVVDNNLEHTTNEPKPTNG